jgi:hypothetical protein
MRWLVPVLVALTLAACGAEETTFDAAADRALFAKAREDARARAFEREDAAARAAAAIPLTGGYTTCFALIEPVKVEWPPVPAGEYAVDALLRLDVRMEAGLEYDRVLVEIFNDGNLPARIGATDLSLHVRQEGSASFYTIVEIGQFTFTISFNPETEIAAGGSVQWRITPYEGRQWHVPKECWTLAAPVEYRARLVSRGIPERKLAACDVVSAWYVSNKPRRWLPDHQTYDMFKGMIQK